MRIHIIAGPNGAGKTTFAGNFLPAEAQCPEFVNADNIAAGLSPFRPDTVALKAGRLMHERIHLLSDARVDFALETTFSTRSYLKSIPRWQSVGYFVELHFLKLPDADWAVRRVAERVQLGGHNIPEATIRRRYVRGWENFTAHYKDLVDAWTLYDSSVMPPRELESGPISDAVEESKREYGSQPESPVTTKRTEGGLAALTRAAEKAIDRARAAGLDPVVRFENPDEATTQDEAPIIEMAADKSVRPPEGAHS